MRPRSGLLWPPPVPDYVALSKGLPEDPRPLAAVLPGPWPSCPSCGRASGWKTSAQDPTLRCPCGTPRPEPEADPRCVRCRATLADPEDLLCAACYAPGRPGVPATFTGPTSDPVAPVGIERGDPATAPEARP